MIGSLSADWYLTPSGDIKMSHSHHEQYATAFLIGLPLGEAAPMHEIHPVLRGGTLELAKRNKTPAKIMNKLQQQSIDSRKIVAENNNWVRLARERGNKFGFDVWVFDEPTLDMIQNSQVWVNEKENLHGDEVVWVSEMSTGDYFELPLKKLLRYGAQPEALRRYAKGVGQFRNPPSRMIIR